MKNVLEIICKSIIILILLFTLTVCKKKNYKTTINGNVLDYYSKNLIPNIDLHIINSVVDPSNPHLRQTDSYDQGNWLINTQADINGTFAFAFDNIKYDQCHLVICNDTLVSDIKYFVSIGHENLIYVYVKRLKLLKLHLKNLSNIYDRISLNTKIDNDFDEFNSPFTVKFNCGIMVNGYNNDTIIFRKTIPDGLCRISYILYKQNSIKADSIFDIHIDNTADTFTYNLFY